MKIFFALLLLISPIVNAEQYKDTRYEIVIRLDDNANIPKIDDNNDYKKYKAWLFLGNIPFPADPVSAPTKSDLDLLKDQLAALKIEVENLKEKVK